LTALAGIAAAEAPGGGGGSSPRMPSASASQFDYAAEYRKGVDALNAKKYRAAREAFTKVLQVGSRDPDTNFLMGAACAGMNDTKAARKYYERAVKLDNKMIDAHRELAVTYAKLGETAKAQAELAVLQQRLAACASKCADATLLKQSINYVQASLQNKPQASIDTGSDLLFASATAGDHAYLQAVALINEKKYDAALTALEAAKASFGAHPDVLTYLGFTNRKLGRLDLAEEYYRQALAAAPNHKGATEYYGELMVERGDMKGAKAMLARLDELCTFGCPESDELRRWVQQKRSPAS
jgi:Tfp pilus assembly protein PilF